MKVAQLFILILAFFVMNTANAGLLIEPVLGYNYSKSEGESGSSIDSKSKGPSYGGRLGYQNFGFQLGLDYLKSDLSVDDSDFDKNMDTTEWAGFVGFEFPILLRVYAGYIFSANASSEYNGQKLELSKGSGTKVGVGFTGLPLVDINVEYRKGTFTDYKFGGTDFDLDVNYSSIMIGISLPFVI